mmetsp:Transcript_72412/g.121329  ORF Transcript_72412/g.121329 Transcript_72412/m.121329 type:complete len:344 (-) Transcript_72412:101-1132(-)
MRHGIGVGGDEHAAGVFVDAQLRGLDLVVVEVAIEANHDSRHVLVMIQRQARRQLHHFASIRGASDVLDAHQVKLLLDANLTNDVDLLVLREVNGLQISGRCVRRRVDLIGLHLQAQAQELLQIPRAGLRRVVCHEEHLLAHRLQHLQRLGHALDQAVPLPDHTVAVEHEHIRLVQKGPLLLLSDHGAPLAGLDIGTCRGVEASGGSPAVSADGVPGPEGVGWQWQGPVACGRGRGGLGAALQVGEGGHARRGDADEEHVHDGGGGLLGSDTGGRRGGLSGKRVLCARSITRDGGTSGDASRRTRVGNPGRHGHWAYSADGRHDRALEKRSAGPVGRHEGERH